MWMTDRSEKYEKYGLGLNVQTMERSTPLAVPIVGW